MLLLGGLGNSLGVWDNLVGELPDFDTIAVDAPGTGFSSTPVLPLSMAELADVYVSLVRSLGLEAVSVLGLSFGGAVAQQLAYQSPGVVEHWCCAEPAPASAGFPGIERLFRSSRRRRGTTVRRDHAGSLR